MSTVYHYCSTDVFCQIISNRTLRFSDISKSNDSAELVWITKDIREELKKEYERQSKEFQEKCPFDKVIWRKTQYSFWRFFDSSTPHTYFVMCFSQKDDSLDQWRGYADDGNGIAIGFDEDRLQELCLQDADPECYGYSNVVYDEKDRKAVIKAEVEAIYKELNEAFSRGEKPDYWNNSYLRHSAELYRIAVLYKNPFFEDEKEKRAYIRWNIKNSISNSCFVDKGNDKIADLDLQYRIKNNILIPYIDAKFVPSFFGKLVNKIILGPKNPCKEGDVEPLLKYYGIHSPVVRSKGTYR